MKSIFFLPSPSIAPSSTHECGPKENYPDQRQSSAASDSKETHQASRLLAGSSLETTPGRPQPRLDDTQSNCRHHPTPLTLKSSFVRASLNTLLAKLPSQTQRNRQGVKEPLSDPRNIRLVYSIILQDARFGITPKTSKTNSFYQKIPLTNSLLQILQGAMKKGTTLDHIAPLSESELLDYFDGNPKALKTTIEALSDLIDRPITQIDTDTRCNSHITQTPVSFIHDQGKAQPIPHIITGLSPGAYNKSPRLINAQVVSEGQHYAIRSARTTTPEAILELAMLNAAQQSPNTTEPVAFSIISALDGLTAKVSLAGYDLLGTDEKLMFNDLKKTVDSLWDHAPNHVRTVTFVQDGKQISKAVQKPVVLNLVLSNAATYSGTMEKATDFNRAQTAHLLDQLAKFAPPEIVSYFPKLPREQKISTLLSHAEKTSNYELRLATLAFKTMDNHTLDKATDALKQSILLHFLLKKCGVAENYQCKSGLDRTPAMLFAGKAADLIIDGIKTQNTGRYTSLYALHHEQNSAQGKAIYQSVADTFNIILEHNPENDWFDTLTTLCDPTGYEAPAPVRKFQETFTQLIQAFCPAVILPTRGTTQWKINDVTLGVAMTHPATYANFNLAIGADPTISDKVMLVPPQSNSEHSELKNPAPKFIPTGPGRGSS